MEILDYKAKFNINKLVNLKYEENYKKGQKTQLNFICGSV